MDFKDQLRAAGEKLGRKPTESPEDENSKKVKIGDEVCKIGEDGTRTVLGKVKFIYDNGDLEIEGDRRPVMPNIYNDNIQKR